MAIPNPHPYQPDDDGEELGGRLHDALTGRGGLLLTQARPVAAGRSRLRHIDSCITVVNTAL